VAAVQWGSGGSGALPRGVGAAGVAARHIAGAAAALPAAGDTGANRGAALALLLWVAAAGCTGVRRLQQCAQVLLTRCSSAGVQGTLQAALPAAGATETGAAAGVAAGAVTRVAASARTGIAARAASRSAGKWTVRLPGTVAAGAAAQAAFCGPHTQQHGRHQPQSWPPPHRCSHPNGQGQQTRQQRQWPSQAQSP
jgi:hypothetical protein